MFREHKKATFEAGNRQKLQTLSLSLDAGESEIIAFYWCLDKGEPCDV
jgi:hypothetical protein